MQVRQAFQVAGALAVTILLVAIVGRMVSNFPDQKKLRTADHDGPQKVAVGMGLLIPYSKASELDFSLNHSTGIVVKQYRGVTFRIPTAMLAKSFGVDDHGFWLLLPMPILNSGSEKPHPAADTHKFKRELSITLDSKWPGEWAVKANYTIPKSTGAPRGAPEPSAFGLTLERGIPKQGQPMRWTRHDLYTSGSLEHPKSFVSLECSSALASEGRLTGPFSREVAGCNMGFLYKEFLVKISFSKTRLSEWRDFKAYTVELLDRLSEDAASPLPQPNRK